MLPVLGACAELVLVVGGADQFPKRDFTAGWAAGCVVEMEMEPVDAVPVGAMVMPGKAGGAAVVLLVDPPNNEAVVFEGTVGAGLVVVRDGACPKLTPAVAAPKMGVKFFTEGLLSVVDVTEQVAVVTSKMGLNPEASRGFVLLTDPELLAGAGARAGASAGASAGAGAAAVAVAVAVTGLEAEEAAGVLIWVGSPNRLAPATGAVLLEALET